MPSSSDFLRTKWADSEGNITDAVAQKYLEDKGFILTEKWFWKLPNPNYHITDDDFSAIQYLIEEWDFGGLI